MDTTAPSVEVEGLYDLTNEQYHADPVPGGSISSSALKIMIQKSPAHVLEYLTGGRPPKGHFDLGSAVHTHILGGAEIVYWGKGQGTDSWQSEAAKKFRRQAYAAGRIPLLEDQREHVEGMVAAIRADADLGPILTPGAFTAEQSGFWVDEPTELWCRFRLDAATYDPDADLLTVVDLKTAHDVSPDAISKAIGNHRYDVQEDHYRAGLRRLMELGLIPEADIQYVLAFVETTPPYVVVPRQIGPRTATHAARYRRWALDQFVICRSAGWWPAYDEDRSDDGNIPTAEAPVWQLRRWDGDVDYYETPEF